MPPKNFDFGKNWQQFLGREINPERLAEAKKSLTEFCGADAVSGKTFVDAGSGSGLFSLAAWELGAERVVSFDINPRSVECTRRLWDAAGRPAQWQVLAGSVLDPQWLAGLGQFDFVYSWGVLHHTGKMWEALRHASSLCRPGGVFYLAIYNKADGFAFYPDGRFGPSSFWVKEKAFYNSLPGWAQAVIDAAAMAAMILVYLLTLRNPAEKICSHQKLRGMSWRTDIKDWLGGYPYEYASADEIFRFMKPLGFALENLKVTNGLLNNEYLFYKKIGA